MSKELEAVAQAAHRSTMNVIDKHTRRAAPLGTNAQRYVLNGVIAGAVQVAWQNRQPGATVESLTKNVSDIVQGIFQQMADDEKLGMN